MVGASKPWSQPAWRTFNCREDEGTLTWLQADGRVGQLRCTPKGCEAKQSEPIPTKGRKGEPRLVGLEGYEIDAVMEGSVIIMRNQDRPGVIGSVGTLLGSRGINVSRMQVGLAEHGVEGLAVTGVDTKHLRAGLPVVGQQIECISLGEVGIGAVARCTAPPIIIAQDHDNVGKLPFGGCSSIRRASEQGM